jgi:hypothetical protein
MLTLFSMTAVLVVATAGPSTAATLNAVASPNNPSTGDFVGSGGSDTQFVLNLGTDPVCSGDSATDGYRVWTYLVKPTVNIDSLTFNANTNASVGYGLYDTAGDYFGDANTAQTTGEVLASGTQIFEWGPAVSERSLLTDLLYTSKKSGLWEGGIACANSSGVLTDNWNVQFTFTKSSSDPNGFTWSAVPGPAGDTLATITSADSATFTEGSSNSFTVKAAGTPTPTLTESGALPSGVTFSGGVLSGDPTATGTFPITFTATNGIGNPATQAFTLTVPAAFEITTTSLPAATIGTAYSATVTASGGTKPYVWKAKGLPKPLKINKTTGVISGTPTSKDAAKTYSVAVTVTDKAKPKGTATKTLSLVLNAA